MKNVNIHLFCCVPLLQKNCKKIIPKTTLFCYFTSSLNLVSHKANLLKRAYYYKQVSGKIYYMTSAAFHTMRRPHPAPFFFFPSQSQSHQHHFTLLFPLLPSLLISLTTQPIPIQTIHIPSSSFQNKIGISESGEDEKNFMPKNKPIYTL